MKIKILTFIFFILFFGCGKKIADITIINDKTVLENEILGEFKELNKEVYLLASVRSIDENGKIKNKNKIPKTKKKVIKAIQRRAFNKDDVNKYKILGVFGENKNGYLEILKQNKKNKAFILFILKQENEDRKIIMERILETNINLNNDKKVVERIFSSVQREKALVGEHIQLPNGKWIIKK